MTDDDPCKAEREALAEAARRYGSGPKPSIGTDLIPQDRDIEIRSEEHVELDKRARDTMAQLEKEFLAAEAAFNDCLKKNSVVPAED